ncbi:MAG: hypothetical protein WA940_02210 [Sphingopyxis sp.]
MPGRLNERYDVGKIRFSRGEVLRWPNTGDVPLSSIVDDIVPAGSVYHILTDVPDDTGIELTILINGHTVVCFELPWSRKRSFSLRRKDEYRVETSPRDVEIWTLQDYRRALGQGKTQILLDHAVQDALRMIG